MKHHTTDMTEMEERVAGMISGFRIDNFIEGWAVAGHGKAHYFYFESLAGPRRNYGPARSLCGTRYAFRDRLFGVGNWELCKTCSRIAATAGGK